MREEEAETEEALVEFGPLTRKDTHKAKQRRKRQKRKAKRVESRKEREAERAAAEGLVRLQRAERADQNSQKAKVHFFAEFSNVGACRNMKVASDEVNAPVKYGFRLCDTKKNHRSNFKKAERVRKLEEQLRKMSWSELKARQIEENRPNPRTRKQWCRSKRKLKKRLEKARVVLWGYRKIFHYTDINMKLAKGDKYVHNKLNPKRILTESKQTYDGPGRKARENVSILAYGEYTERLKWKIQMTEGKSYIAGASERGTTKTCLYCGKWNPKLKVSDKDFTCRNRACGQVYRRDPGSAMHNAMEGCQALLEAREEAERGAEQAERPRRNPPRVRRRVQYKILFLFLCMSEVRRKRQKLDEQKAEVTSQTEKARSHKSDEQKAER